MEDKQEEKKEKSCYDIMNEVADEICEHYCRFPYEIDDEDTLYNTKCELCPLSKLV